MPRLCSPSTRPARRRAGQLRDHFPGLGTVRPRQASPLAGLLGVLSVTGRLVTTALARRRGMAAITAAIFVVQAAGAAALPHLGRSLAGAAACVLVAALLLIAVTRDQVAARS